MKLPFFYLILFISLTANAQQQTTALCDSLLKAGLKKSNNGDYLGALELLTKAESVAAKNNLKKQQSSIKNNMGTCHFSVLDYGEALKYYRESYTIAQEIKDTGLELKALNNIAILYTRENELQKAFEYFKKAYDTSKIRKDSLEIAIYSLNVGVALNEMKKLADARRFLDESIRFGKNKPHVQYVARTAIAENEMLLGHHEASRAMAHSLLDEVEDKTNNQDAISLLLVIAKTYENQQNYDQAIKHTLTALGYNIEDTATKVTIFDILSDNYAKSGQYNLALQYKDSVLSTQKELDNIKNGRLFENNRVKFEMQDYKNQISRKEADLQHQKKLYYWIIGGLVSLALLIFFIFRNLSMRHKQRKLIAENRQQQLELELTRQESEALIKENEYRQQQHDILLEQERLKNEIEHKNRKLSSQALHTSGKYQMIQDVISLLSEQPELAELPAVKKHIRFLRNSLNSDNEWDSFLTHFEEVNQGFLSRLKARHTELTPNDVRFICYVYMNLNSKEIASMLNISPDACRKRKERVSAKLSLVDSGALYSYLSEI